MGQEIVVRLHKRAAPLEVEVYKWAGVDDEGNAKGEPTPLPSTLRPVIVSGETRSWEVVIGVPTVGRHLYLGVSAYWADEEGCGGHPDLGSQSAAWTFHLRRS